MGQWRSTKKFLEAAKVIDGEQVKVGAPGTGKARQSWFQERFDTSVVQLDKSARELIAEHLGEDVARLTGLLQTLEGVYGADAQLTESEVQPFIGDEGECHPGTSPTPWTGKYQPPFAYYSA